jgi:glycosyltransferase WbpL
MAGDLLPAVSAAFLASTLLTAVVRRVAMARGVLDLPTSRSSHTSPTPRGGGLAVVVTVLASIGIMTYQRVLPHRLAAALLAGGAVVALVGLIDDVRSVSVAARLSIQFAALGWCCWSLGALPAMNLGFAVWNPGVIGSLAALIFLVWFLNLFNFMDGIDGLAGVEAVSVTSFAAILLLHEHGTPSIVLLLVIVAASVSGFLVWNWPPARIFMGDAGSGFLGFCLGVIGWETVAEGRFSIWAWFILLGVFIVDATSTLLRRWLRGAQLTQAHRSHAYQRLSRRYGSHLRVTLGVLAVNILWLDPLAYMAIVRPSIAFALMLTAWAPLALFAWLSGAGLDDEKVEYQ